MRRGNERRTGLAQHGAEVGIGWLAPETEKAQPRRFQYHPAHSGRDADHDDRQHIGQKFREDDPCVSKTCQSCRVDEFTTCQRYRDASDIAGKEGDVHGGHRDKRIHQPRTERRHNS